jgi:hypothetical protein
MVRKQTKNNKHYQAGVDPLINSEDPSTHNISLVNSRFEKRLPDYIFNNTRPSRSTVLANCVIVNVCRTDGASALYSGENTKMFLPLE